MAASKLDLEAGATSHLTENLAELDLQHWHSIDWPKVHQQVRRLQTRIVKAEAGCLPTASTLERLKPLAGKLA